MKIASEKELRKQILEEIQKEPLRKEQCWVGYYEFEC